MSEPMIRVRELVGWGLDAYEYRPVLPIDTAVAHAYTLIAARPACTEACALLAEAAQESTMHAARPDLLEEMHGMEWSVGMVDLRHLIAFQRRLSFHPEHRLIEEPFPPPKPTPCSIRHDGDAFVIASTDPNLHLRLTGDPTHPLALHAGSPFFEVAEYRGRWFLRDGYHRAFRLLQRGIQRSPAVIVRARTLAELGANQPWFFSESVLFGERPPMVTDFLDDALNIDYERPVLLKTLRVTMEESLAPICRQSSTTGDPS